MANLPNDYEDANGMRHVKFATWGDFLEFVDGEPLPGSDCSSQRSSYDFTGTESFAEARKLAQHGWTEGTERVRSIVRRLEARLLHRIVREDVNYDVEGMGFDVARYIEGEPEHWVRLEESTMQEDSHRHVKVIVHGGALGDVSTETMLAKGAVAAALVELLEFAGHNVELHHVAAVEKKRGAGLYFASWIRLKAYDQPLDMDRVAFALAHPSMHRRLTFKVRERCDAALTQWSYGATEDCDPKDGSLYVPSARSGDIWTNPAKAEAFVVAALASQGVIVSDED